MPPYLAFPADDDDDEETIPALSQQYPVNSVFVIKGPDSVPRKSCVDTNFWLFVIKKEARKGATEIEGVWFSRKIGTLQYVAEPMPRGAVLEKVQCDRILTHFQTGKYIQGELYWA